MVFDISHIHCVTVTFASHLTGERSGIHQLNRDKHVHVSSITTESYYYIYLLKTIRYFYSNLRSNEPTPYYSFNVSPKVIRKPG